MADFTNRFVAATSYTNESAQQLSEQQLLSTFPELVEMARMVRNHSILLRNVSNVPTIRIFNTITQHADPRIALYMSGAKRKDNTHYFVGLEQVRNLMFGEPDPNPTTNQDLFRDGIRRVSAALAAATLVGEFSQLPEQFQHAKLLEEQALADLKAIVESYAVDSSKTSSTDSSVEAAFYFEPGTIATGVICEFYIPSLPYAGWQTAASYTGPVLVSTIIADIADAINEACLAARTTNVMCAPIMTDSTTLHKMVFQARSILPELYSEVICLKIYSAEDPTVCPVRWGIKENVLRNNPLNSLIILIKNAKFTSRASPLIPDVTSSPDVIYFRKIIDTNPTTDTLLKYRVLAHSELLTEITIPRLTDPDIENQQDLDYNRHSQTAEALAQDLAVRREQTKVVAAIVRNDPLTYIPEPYCALQLVAFSFTNPYITYVLDILELPPDVEIALGDLNGPITSFSRRPRSIKIPVNVFSVDATKDHGIKDKPRLSKVKHLNVSQVIKDEDEYVNYIRGLV